LHSAKGKLMDKIVIIGSSGHAKVVIDIVEQEGKYAIAGLVDRGCRAGEPILGYDVLGQDEDLPSLIERHSLAGAIVAIGDNFIRSNVAARITAACPGIQFLSAIHPRASIAREVSIGVGTVIMAGVVVNPCCAIGRFCILNSGSSLDHDSIMGDFSSLAPRATTGGNCRIGAYSALCIGAVLTHGVSVGEHAVVGAGSTVLGDIESHTVAYGTPARPIRQRPPGGRYL
jgi:sugar O-acyltransferase (sialic acid O-acetyltransferase NeuD family)